MSATIPEQSNGDGLAPATLIPTTVVHPPKYRGVGVESPHAVCQATVSPYNAAQRVRTRLAVLVICTCGSAWREERRTAG